MSEMNEAQMDEWLNKKLDELLPNKLQTIDDYRHQGYT